MMMMVMMLAIKKKIKTTTMVGRQSSAQGIMEQSGGVERNESGSGKGNSQIISANTRTSQGFIHSRHPVLLRLCTP